MAAKIENGEDVAIDEDEDGKFFKQSIRGFRNNTKLKRPGENISWSEEMISEYQKCHDDVLYFAKKYFKIVHVDRGMEIVKLFPYQEKLLKQLVKNRFNIILQCRQSGKTTAVTIYFCWMMLFHRDKTFGILANKGMTAREILSRIQLAYENLPKWLQQGIITWNKGFIELENGCKVLAAATSSSAIRGFSMSRIYIDECAFIPTNIWEEFYRSIYPTISSGKETQMIITSSANGYNHFYKMWFDSVEKRNSYVAFEVLWYDVPGRDEQWKLETIANTDEDSFLQEQENQFLGSSNTLIPMKKLKTLVFKPAIKETENGLKIYEEVYKAEAEDKKLGVEDGMYVVIVDTSEGVMQDNSAFSIIRIDTIPYKQVAVYKNNTISPTAGFPDLINKLAKYYNDAAILVETNGPGIQVSNTLFTDLENENVLFTVTKGRKGQVLSGGFKKNSMAGVKTSSMVKRVGCSALKDLIINDKMELQDFDTISELSTFVKSKGSFAADEGSTDDIAMTLVLFGWLTTQQYFKDLNNLVTRERLFADQIQEMEEDLIPAGIFNNFMHTNDDEIVVEGGHVWTKTL